MKNRIWGIPCGLAVVLAGCSEPVEQDSSSVPKTSESVKSDVVFKDLRAPWNIEKNQEVFYITERNGAIVKGTKDDYVRMNLDLKEQVVAEGEGGLLGMALDPDFTDNQTAYIYHTYEKNGSLLNRIIAIVEQDGIWKEQRVLLDAIPGASIHNGGRIEIGPDGLLYVTVGDAAVPENAQKLSSLSGKILRMKLDGRAASGNLQDYVYSYGHRNPQGLVFFNQTLYATEHGQSGHDEINRIETKNYGWPLIEGTEKQQGLVTPWYEVGEQSVAPSGVAELGGKLYFGTLVGQSLRSIETSTAQVEQVVSDRGRIRDVMTDGKQLYYVTNNTDGRGNPSDGDDVLIRLEL
ncbi:PQQ-dependent sugar dehydrogenase [Exiguobacterium antarcticum]|uniref:PQQ-dependent sugar dehydrogenase n=1 Tax=Exiguobacterium antarcticum TaxID=132920 RepID=UPI00047EEB92|nr:PQQ-dependent sugar dehydrogenase [Exiguobacterium antarcticum]